MPGLDLLILNGASGTGKTTTATKFCELVDTALWVHPDGIWETPKMDAESILRLALEHSLRIQNSGLTVLDCQIQPSLIPALVDAFDIRRWVSVLLICPKQQREARLLARGWSTDEFDRIEEWAGILHQESVAANDLVVDSSAHDIRAICNMIIEHIQQHGLQHDA